MVIIPEKDRVTQDGNYLIWQKVITDEIERLVDLKDINRDEIRGIKKPDWYIRVLAYYPTEDDPTRPFRWVKLKVSNPE